VKPAAYPDCKRSSEIDRNDPSNEVRAQITFALSLNHEPGALDEMIRMAHEDESTHVRGQALFWLAQEAGQKSGEHDHRRD